MPGKNTPVTCTGCVTPATNKLTYPYKDPLVRHVGRYLDSTTTGNVQNAGMRTVRARMIRSYPGRNRIYIRMGEMAALYDMRTFFNATLAQPLAALNTISMSTTNGWGSRPGGYERIQLPDRFFYSESRDSTWVTAPIDAQLMLTDTDLDDRGYVYVGTIANGWGIVRDNGTNGGSHLDPVVQITDGQIARSIIALKVGANYYAVISETISGAEGAQVYDATTASAPFPVAGVRKGRAHGIKAWAKYDDGSRLAIVHTDGRLAVYDYSGYVNNGVSVAQFTPSAGKAFTTVSFDETGRIWAAESNGTPGKNELWKLTPSGSSYSTTKLDVYPQNFDPVHIHAAGGYVALMGGTGVAPNLTYDLMLYKVNGGVPTFVNTDGFFGKYYHRAPNSTYTAQADYNPAYFEAGGVQIVEQGNKTYILYSAGGLGDVFEIEGGESISLQQLPGPYGTVNPNSTTTDGPYYGDTLKFKATSNNAAANYTVDWDFGNPDSGNLNGAQSALNAIVQHQYTGLNTAAKIGTARSVTAKVTTDHSISGQYPVILKVPTARIVVPGVAAALTQQTKAAFEAVPGEVFKDASDGTVEGHFSTWIIDGVPTSVLPNATMPVGALGAHTVAFTASYGTYNATTFAASSPYVATISSINYHVKPFVTSPITQSMSGTNYTYNATPRYSPSAVTASQWTVTWTLTGGSSAGSVAAQEASTVTVGTVPPFTVPKSTVTNGSVVTLTISVDPSAVPAPSYANYTQTFTVSIPVINVNLTSGCTNAGEDCTITAASANNQSTASWKLSWSIKRGTNEVASGQSNPITFKPSQEGSYTATVTETTFGVTAQKQFSVAGVTCGPVAEEFQANVSADCTTCTAGVELTLNSNLFGYQVQPCDTLSWDFGDSTPIVSGKGEKASVKHTYSRNGTFRPKFTIKNSSYSREWTGSVTVGGSTPNTCLAPAGVSITYTGNKGCSPSVPCKNTETITFRALRNGGALQSCDNVNWTFDGTEVVEGQRTVARTLTTGTHSVTAVVTNTAGVSSPFTQNITIVADTGPVTCEGSAQDFNLAINYTGPESGCSSSNPSKPCKVGESIRFIPSIFGYTVQSCDKFDWNFGDNTSSTSREPQKSYSSPRDKYTVTLKVSNSTNPSGASVTVDVPFAVIPETPVAELEFVSFPASASKNTRVTFTARVKNTNQVASATGWVWDFGDQTVDTSQSTFNGAQTTITHTYTRAGNFNVSVRARNAVDTSSNPKIGQAGGSINIVDVPEYRYLLPVIAHGPGQNNSVWRSDVQVYNPDPNAGVTPLNMTATFRGVDKALQIHTSTHIFTDFLNVFTNGNDQGPVIITVRAQHAPQIWTRTYNQTEAGTFGQFIPAIRLDSAGGGAAFGDGKYFMAGLRNDNRYRTNLGLVNPNAQTINANVRVYDDQGLQIGSFTRTLGSFQLDQFPITHATAAPNIDGKRPFSVEIQVPAGQWLVAYASFVDGGSNDPVWIQALRESEFSSPDYRSTVVPGVGHIGAWRSDVTIYNPNGRTIPVDLAYHDQTGAKVAEAKAVPVGAGEFLQYEDLLKQGIFGNITTESLGMLRVTVPETISADRFPMTFARTYNDNGSGKTYGQGIPGFATARANVRPGKAALIAGIRSNAGYYTNVGATNVSDTAAVVKVKRLDPVSGAELELMTINLAPNQSVVGRVNIAPLESASLKIEVTGGNVWAFASQVDKSSSDPEYIAATPLP
jgi:PKD repeat protein